MAEPDSGAQRRSTQSTQSSPLDDASHQRFVGDKDLTVWSTAGGRQAAHLSCWLSRRLSPHQILALSLCAGLALVALLTALAGGVYDSVTESDGVAGLDAPALQTAESMRSPLGNALATAYTNIGGTIGMPVLATVVAVGLALRWRRWTPVVLIAATAAGSLALTVVGKSVVGRTRPPLSDAVPPYELSASFPSGHSLNSIALAGIVAYLLVREQRSARARALTIAAAAAFAFTMGLSRVYLGHHWLTDVLVAWALGSAWLLTVIIAHRMFLTVRHPTADRSLR